MHTLYIMRHGPAAATSSAGDPGRPLTAPGRLAVAAAAAHLAGQPVRPTQILASTHLRTMQTASLVAEALGLPPAQGRAALCPGASPEAAWDLLATAAALPPTVLLVGHMPDVADWVGAWTADAPRALHPASLAHLRFSGPIRPGAGRLMQCWHADV